jgi:hypothetical protein
MSRKILILSTVVLLAGVALLIYADPLARLSLGTGTSRVVSFTSSVTRTVTFGSSTFTISPGSGGFPTGGFTAGGLAAGRGAVDTNGQIETLVAVALLGVGLVLEVITIFLWQGRQQKQVPQPTTG